MTSSNLKYGLYFVLLVIAQTLVFNNIQISDFLNPYVYILFVLLLPFEVPGWLLLSSSFLLGLFIDVFPQGWGGQGSTVGIHAGATVLAAFARPTVLKWINPRDDYEPGTLPSASHYGFRWYFTYAVIIVLIHHFALFTLEHMMFSRMPEVILRTLLSALLTLFFIMVWEAFRFRRR